MREAIYRHISKKIILALQHHIKSTRLSKTAPVIQKRTAGEQFPILYLIFLTLYTYGHQPMPGMIRNFRLGFCNFPKHLVQKHGDGNPE